MSRCKHCSKGSQVPACLITAGPQPLSPLLHPGRWDEEGWRQLHQLSSFGELLMSVRPFLRGLSPEETESEPQKSAGHQAHAPSLVGEDDVRRWMGLG